MAYYREKLAEHSALWADLYAVTMSQAFFHHQEHNTISTFHAYIRKTPFGGAYLITGGQNIIREWLEKYWHFDERDIEVLSNKKVLDIKTGEMKPLFTIEFLNLLKDAKFECDVDMMPEGEVAFPDEPIVRVRGPLWQCLMVEAAILNIINSQSLFATLASRLMEATKSQNIVLFTHKTEHEDHFGTVLEFGLRRAQSLGGLEASRGAYLGGITATSNVLAEKYYNIPTAGTFAHALVMSYEDELEAFSQYAQAMPYNGIFLVDTYDTLEGVQKAIEACQKHHIALKGIRLDSGDLVELSKQARVLLDNAGWGDAKIAASNDLEESSIREIIKKGGKIDIWGVGTNLVTSKAQPALGAVYKMGAIYNSDITQEMIDVVKTEITQHPYRQLPENFMRDVIKLSQDFEKTTLPGELDVLRVLFNDRSFSHDIIVRPETVLTSIQDTILTRDISSGLKKESEPSHQTKQDVQVYRVLQSFFQKGKLIAKSETVHDARERALKQKSRLPSPYKDLDQPQRYPVSIEMDILKRRQQLIEKHRIQKKHNIFKKRK